MSIEGISESRPITETNTADVSPVQNTLADSGTNSIAEADDRAGSDVVPYGDRLPATTTGTDMVAAPKFASAEPRVIEGRIIETDSGAACNTAGEAAADTTQLGSVRSPGKVIIRAAGYVGDTTIVGGEDDRRKGGSLIGEMARAALAGVVSSGPVDSRDTPQGIGGAPAEAVSLDTPGVLSGSTDTGTVSNPAAVFECRPAATDSTAESFMITDGGGSLALPSAAVAHEGPLSITVGTGPTLSELLGADSSVLPDVLRLNRES